MPGPFACKACGASFATEAELKQHGAAHMGGAAAPASAPSFECKACGAHFPSEAELTQHGQQMHRM